MERQTFLRMSEGRDWMEFRIRLMYVGEREIKQDSDNLPERWNTPFQPIIREVCKHLDICKAFGLLVQLTFSGELRRSADNEKRFGTLGRISIQHWLATLVWMSGWKWANKNKLWRFQDSEPITFSCQVNVAGSSAVSWRLCLAWRRINVQREKSSYH